MNYKVIYLAAALVTILALAGCAGPMPVTEVQVRQEYDRLVATAPSREEYLVRHILVQTREQALAALDRIKAGESFGSVAQSVSADPSSRDRGGELGWCLTEFFIEEFSKTMTSLKPRGLAVEPTRTRFGWHVIEVTEVKMGKATFPSYESMKEKIAERLRQRVAANK